MVCRAMRGVSGALWLIPIVLLSGGHPGCGTSSRTEALEGAVEDVAALSGLLEGSWYAEAVKNPGGLEALLDGPGGAGWLALFHGDLEKAEQEFISATSGELDAPGAHLGLARVALARADALRAGRALEARIAPRLVEYRRTRGDRVRSGSYESLLAALTVQGFVGEGADLDAAAAAAAGWTPGPGVDPVVGSALHSLLIARREAGSADGSGLPRSYVDSLTLAGAVRAGQRSVDPLEAEPDFVDQLGVDADTGVRFTAKFWDPVVSEARFLNELLLIMEHGAAAGDAGVGLVQVAVVAWGDGAPTLPGLGASAPPGVSSVPVELALVGAPWADIEDLRAAWDERPARTLLQRLAEVAPEKRLRDGQSAADVDRVLRYENQLVDVVGDALTAMSTGTGASLVHELELPRKVADQILRQRMKEMARNEQPIQAQRLAERSLDVAGGQDGAAGTRVSHRNDVGFLVRLGAVHSAGRRPGVAREYIHPLVGQHPGLAPVAYTLGQLDAASSIGVQGKTSQH